MNRWEDLLFRTEPGFFGEIIRTPLWFLSLFYLLGVKIRLWAYQNQVLKSHHPPLPIISIGNLTLGGTGKTPTAVWLAKRLKEKGFAPALSLRGYGSPAEKKLIVIQGKEFSELSAQEIGDEPAMLIRTLKDIPILIGKNRLLSAIKAKELGADLLILDDGFQHLRLKRTLELVLIDATHSLNSEKIFPRGRLREPRSSLQRADIVILTRAGKDPELVAEEIKKIHPQCPVFQMRYQVLEPKKYRGKKAYLFAGIAQPEQFWELAQSVGVKIVGKRAFSDHHYYQVREIKQIETEAQKSGAEILLTTEKDLVRLPGVSTKIPVQALRIELDFFARESQLLDLVITRLKEQPHA